MGAPGEPPSSRRRGLPLHPFRPALLGCLPGYDGRAFGADLVSGITVALVALPLAMAFAIASGLKPEAGIFTAVIAGFLISMLGGSRVQIGGPAGAFIVIVYGIVSQHGVANLILATVMAGVLLFVMGLTRVGSLIRFIPVSIIIGFTNGIAVLIALSQVKDFLGLPIDKMPADFFGLTRTIAGAIGAVHWPAVALALACLGLIVGWPRLGTLLSPPEPGQEAARTRLRLVTRLPASLVALVLATAATALLQIPVETIGSRFGSLPTGLPAFAWPDLSWDSAHNLVGPTLSIALLGAVESLLCARVADGMTGDRHDPNQELMAQGVANLVTPFFGGMPATGTIARTTVNVRTGARTPIAGMIHAVALLAIVLAAAPLARHVPLAALAAILMTVAWNMGEWREFARLRQFSNQYRAVMLSTFLLTVVVDLTVAIEFGMVLAALFFIYRVSSLTASERVADATLPPGVVAYRLYGSLFFGAVGKLEQLLEEAERSAPRALVLDLHRVINIDTTGLDMLDVMRKALAKRGAVLVLCDPNEQPSSLFRRSGFLEKLGVANLQPSLADGLARGRAIVAEPRATGT